MLNWGEQVGLLEASLETSSIALGLNHNVVNDVLLEIQAAFRGCVDIQVKYNPFIEPPNPPAQPRRASTRKALLERVLNVSNKSARAATRLQWAMIKKDSFEKLIAKLIMFNDRVESLLDRNALGELHDMQVQSNLMLLQVTDGITQLRLLVEALNITGHPADQITYKRLGDNAYPCQGSLDGIVASLARFKAEASLVAQDILQKVPTRIEFSHLLFEDAERGKSRSLGRYDGQEIWLEWREQVEDAQSSPEIQQIVDRRVKQLAALLSVKDKSPLFRAPSCIGYTYDKRDENYRHALAYKVELPSDTRYLGISTLRDILDTNPVPSLGKRFALASALADSVFYLHAVSWLHKGIRSDNVLFVRYQSTIINQDVNESPAADISSPILSGFDYSRPDLIDEQSFRNNRTPRHDIYSHPDLLQFRTKRSRKCHDMYSLGLILIEIALWRPIENIVGIEVRRSRLLEIAQTVAKLNEKDNIMRAELAARMGDRYADVVTFCVASEEGDRAVAGSQEDDPKLAAELQELFFENAVQKLRRFGG